MVRPHVVRQGLAAWEGPSLSCPVPSGDPLWVAGPPLNHVCTACWASGKGPGGGLSVGAAVPLGHSAQPAHSITPFKEEQQKSPTRDSWSWPWALQPKALSTGNQLYRPRWAWP